MQQRILGRTGLSVSALGFGCGAVGGLMVLGDPGEQKRAVVRALEAGITYFDTAASYGDGRSEENLGRVMRDVGGWDRVVVGTKVRVPSLENARVEIRAGLEASLKRLGRADVDIFHLHNPISREAGARGLPLDVVLGEVARGFEDVIQAGLVHHVGFTALGDTSALIDVTRAEPYETVQTYFNVLNPSAGFPGHSGGQQDLGGLIDTAASAGVGVIVIRVLAGGAAAGTLERAENANDPGGPLVSGSSFEADVERARSLATVATEAGVDGPVELALRFGLSKPGISTVLVGYSNFGQLEDAIRWAERGPLPDDVVQRVVASA
ncbi:MAG TPA: aldo/keto reductase [Chloroflexota bacterium]|jgi:L-galactose dehydrogenase/L-glyceraldehyde 3-phosphate reductase